MIDEELGYLDAKKKASKTVLRGGWARRKDLPSNGEIREAVRRLTAWSDGDDQGARLFAMRITALEHMEVLEAHRPRLIGSVATGHVRRGSDIDLHVFPSHPDLLERDLRDLRWHYEREDVLIQTPNGFQTYLHFHVEGRFPLELSVYEPAEMRVVGRSSTDGKRIDRVSRTRLIDRIRSDHPHDWERWHRTGVLNWEEGPEPGRYDGLLTSVNARLGEKPP